MSFADALRANPALEKLTEDLKCVNSGFSPLMMKVAKEYGDVAEYFAAMEGERLEKARNFPDAHKAWQIYESVNHGCKSIIHYFRGGVDTAAYLKKTSFESVGETLLECAEKTREELGVAKECGLEECPELESAFQACDKLEALATCFIEEQKQARTR